MSIWAAIVPWMALTPQGIGIVEAPVVYSNGSLSPPLVCTREGENAWMTAEAASRLGWNIRFGVDSAKVEAHSKQFEVPLRKFGSVNTFSFRDAISALSGETSWHEDSLWVFASLPTISVETNRVRITTTLPISAKISMLSNPPRVVVDVHNAKINPSKPPTLVGSLRYAQFGEEMVRVVVQTDKMPSGPTLMSAAGETIVSWTSAVGVKTEPYKSPLVALDPMLLTIPQEGETIEPAPAAMPLRLGPPTLERDSPSEVIVSIKYFGKVLGAPEITLEESGAYVVDLRDANMLASQQVQIINGQNLRSASLTKTREGVRIRVEFNRIMLARIAGAAGELIIRATPPREALNGIKGVLVAIDARKGGKDSGESFEIDGATQQEPALNLDVAEHLAQKLMEVGAKPLQIRNGDATMTEYDRTALANTKKAALLVSVGFSNEFGNPTVRYHASSPSGRMLAACIAAKIPNCELRTFDSWLLRKTNMPAVLVTLGDIRSPKTQSLLSKPEARHQFAEQIAEGVISFSKGDRLSA